MTLSLSRREALAGAASALLAGWPASATAAPFTALESAAAIGRAALAAGVRPLSAAQAARRFRDLPTRSRQDFARGRTVIVDGWMLARTEARFFAHIAQTAGV